MAGWWTAALLCGALAGGRAEAAPESAEGSAASNDEGGDAPARPEATAASLAARAEALRSRASLGAHTEEIAVADGRACGEAYVELAARAAEVGDASEALFNAALCFERACAHGAAAAARRQLLARDPDGPLSAPTTEALIVAALRFARFAEAASLAEDYVLRFAERP
jgi:hypothetical protein